MGLFRSRSRIRKLQAQLIAVHSVLRIINAKQGYVPSPAELKALTEIRSLLQVLVSEAAATEKLMRQRIKTWQRTPWTRRQRFWRCFNEMAAAWFACTLALSTTILGWFTPSPLLWPLSAGIACVVVGIGAWRTRKDR